MKGKILHKRMESSAFAQDLLKPPSSTINKTLSPLPSALLSPTSPNSSFRNSIKIQTKVEFTPFNEVTKIITSTAQKNVLFLVGLGVLYIPPSKTSLQYLIDYGKKHESDSDLKIKTFVIDEESHRKFCDENELVVGTPILQMFFNGRAIKFRYLRSVTETSVEKRKSLFDQVKAVNVYIGQLHSNSIHQLVTITKNTILEMQNMVAKAAANSKNTVIPSDIVVDIDLNDILPEQVKYFVQYTQQVQTADAVVEDESEDNTDSLRPTPSIEKNTKTEMSSKASVLSLRKPNSKIESEDESEDEEDEDDSEEEKNTKISALSAKNPVLKSTVPTPLSVNTKTSTTTQQINKTATPNSSTPKAPVGSLRAKPSAVDEYAEEDSEEESEDTLVKKQSTTSNVSKVVSQTKMSDEEDEEEDEKSVKSATKNISISNTKPTAKYESEDDFSEDEESDTPPNKSNINSNTTVKSNVLKPTSSQKPTLKDEFAEDDSEDEPKPTPIVASKPTTSSLRSKPTVTATVTSTVQKSTPSSKLSSTTTLKPSKSDEYNEDESSEEDVLPKKQPMLTSSSLRSTPAITKQSKIQKSDSEESDDNFSESEDEKLPVKKPIVASTKSQPTSSVRATNSKPITTTTTSKPPPKKYIDEYAEDSDE